MIKDAGFTIKADHALEELLKQEDEAQDLLTIDERKTLLKDIKDLRPQV